MHIDTPVFDAGRPPVPTVDRPDHDGAHHFRRSPLTGAVIPWEAGVTVRTPAEHRALVAKAGMELTHEPTDHSNLGTEFLDKRIPAELCETAEAFEIVYQQAHTPPASPTKAECLNRSALTAPERHARGRQMLRLIEYRCGHLYIDLVSAVIEDEPMSTIGARYGGNTKDSAKIGRLRVVDALTFAQGAMRDLARWEASQQARIRTGAKMQPIVCRAIGQQAGLPDWIHEAANDDVRRLDLAA
ncbi:hypothetical protein ACLBXM_02665 [Xanthobacteraceae bacterium A53D]